MIQQDSLGNPIPSSTVTSISGTLELPTGLRAELELLGLWDPTKESHCLYPFSQNGIQSSHLSQSTGEYETFLRK